MNTYQKDPVRKVPTISNEAVRLRYIYIITRFLDSELVYVEPVTYILVITDLYPPQKFVTGSFGKHRAIPLLSS
jgi:hypothetical protein